ncbi:hypothetical protein ACFPIJ_63915 [Dactylosporangium cerinum]|uniref:EfeO-type cupredoxin-like domain-containing protein n=1 Tax=Dactylosporangium cerinum TaxID=1434730 RepID=A0ABV9WIS1_9ACTN
MPAARSTVAAACLLAFLTAGCDSPAAAPTTGAPATSAAPVASPGASVSPTAGPTSAPPSPVPAFDKEVVVTVAKRKVTPPTGRVEVAKGSLVRITVTSDVADELHVHGYDKTLALPAGTPASIDLRVDKTGLFEVETHSSHLVLFQLVVR